MDPRIRIHSKMSWIRKTVHNFYQCLHLIVLPRIYIYEPYSLGLQVAGYSSPCGRSLHSLPAAVAVPPSAARTTPLNIPLTVQTTTAASHSSSHLHHPPPLLTYPPPSSTELRGASPALYPPYNLATSGVSLSIIQTNVICSGPRSLPPSNPPPVMSSPHSISGSNSNSSGVIVVPLAHTTANNSSSSNSSAVIGTIAPRGGCGPGCKCSGPLTRSRKRKLCTAVRGGGGVASGYPRPAEDSSQLAFDTGRGGGGGKCLRSGTITIE
jgi:hypothetical protein